MKRTLPKGVKKQVDLFLADYPKTGNFLAERYLKLVTSDEYLCKSTEKSENKNTEKTKRKKHKNDKR